VGEKEAPGRPKLYGTTERFLEVFGLESLEDLPPLEEGPPLLLRG
jgi:segregation and condensation protein B